MRNATKLYLPVTDDPRVVRLLETCRVLVASLEQAEHCRGLIEGAQLCTNCGNMVDFERQCGRRVVEVVNLDKVLRELRLLLALLTITGGPVHRG